jgi:hypothetical protein
MQMGIHRSPINYTLRLFWIPALAGMTRGAMDAILSGYGYTSKPFAFP